MTDNSEHLAMLDSTRAFLAADKRMFIDGQWRDNAKGATLDVINPADGSLLARFCRARTRTTWTSPCALRAAL